MGNNWLARIGLVVFGILLAVLLLEGGMRAAGWALDYRQAGENRAQLEKGGEFRVLCLGESTTIGEPWTRSYPEYLQAIFDAQFSGVQVSVINGGRFGTITGEILAFLEEDIATYEPHLVVTMMGVNDAGRTHTYGSLIEPGRGRWYGSMRIYKLYRVLRVGVQKRLFGAADVERLKVAEGIVWSDQTGSIGGRENARVPSFRSSPDEATEILLSQARTLFSKSRFEEAERILLDILVSEPTTVGAYVELFFIYTKIGDLDNAHQILVQGAESIPGPSIDIVDGFATSYENLGQLDCAIESLLELRNDLVSEDDTNTQIHYAGALARVHEKAGNIDRAEQYLREIVDRISPGDSRYYPWLIEFCERHGRMEEAERLRVLETRIREDYVNPRTRSNYLKVRGILDSNGIDHVAVQYPGRRVESLKQIFDHDEGSIYVDNSFFTELVQRDGVEVYFSDLFAGDFGHLTDLANELLAENIARAIVEQHFGLDFDENWRSP